MSIDDLSKVAGVFGFFISLATFALTRWERRTVLVFSFDSGTASDFKSDWSSDKPEEDESPCTVNLTITNLGSRNSLLDLQTVEVRSKAEKLLAWREGHWGTQQREVLLKPGDSQAIGIPLKTFEGKLAIEIPKKYDEKSLYRMYPLKVLVKEVNGKLHVGKNLRYWAAVGEFHRST